MLKSPFDPIISLYESIRSSPYDLSITESHSEDPLAEELPLDDLNTKIPVEQLRDEITAGKSLSSGDAADIAGCTRESATKYLNSMVDVYDDVIAIETKGGTIWRREYRIERLARKYIELRKLGWQSFAFFGSIWTIFFTAQFIIFLTFLPELAIGLEPLPFYFRQSWWVSIIVSIVSGLLCWRSLRGGDNI